MEDISGELRKFLKKFQLTSYEINTYLSLVSSAAANAKEISLKANVPTGRIYDVLEHLIMLGLIEVQDARPKKYQALTPNSAFRNLIARFDENNQRNIQLLYSQARELEKEIQASQLMGPTQAPSLFWSTAYGIKAISTLYRDRIRDVEREFLLTGFINEHTLDLLARSKPLYGGLFLKEHPVSVKFLWSFDLDERNPSPNQLIKNDRIYRRLGEILESSLPLSTSSAKFEMRYVNQRIFTYFDIADENRVILKLRNPAQPSQIFACISVLDPDLARNLKAQFIEIWSSTAIS